MARAAPPNAAALHFANRQSQSGGFGRSVRLEKDDSQAAKNGVSPRRSGSSSSGTRGGTASRRRGSRRRLGGGRSGGGRRRRGAGVGDESRRARGTTGAGGGDGGDAVGYVDAEEGTSARVGKKKEGKEGGAHQVVDVPAAIVTSSEYARVPVESLSSRVMVSPYAIGRRKKKGSQRAEGKKGQRSARLGVRTSRRGRGSRSRG